MAKPLTAISPNHAERAMSKLDAQLTCGVCLDRYTDPRTLPCHHSFCKNCIDPLPVQLDNGRPFIKCPMCQTLTHLSEDRAFPPAFHVNTLLEIDELLRKSPANEPVQVCSTHNKPRDIFCETCDRLICLRCTKSHHAHQYSSAAELYEKHKREIEACLKPLKKRTDEVEKILQSYKVRDEEIAKYGKAVKAKIDKSVQQHAESLLLSKKTFGKTIDSIVREKQQLNRCQKREVEAVYARLKSCHELVEGELVSRSHHQIQEARKRLIELIYNTTLEARVGELQPAQIADITFEPNQTPPDLGSVHYSMYYSVPGIFTVCIPELVVARMPSKVTISSLMLFSSERLSCQLSLSNAKKAASSQPLMCPITDSSPSQCTVEFCPHDHGTHKLSIKMDDHDIHGSPFPLNVYSIPDARGQSLKIFAEGLNTPRGITVSEDGKLVLVTEWNGHSVRVLPNSGGEMGKVDAKLKNPWGVALSTDNYIYVADAKKLRKFSPSGALMKSIELCTCMDMYGIAINRQTEIVYFVNRDKSRVDVVNSNLQKIQSISEHLEQPHGIAIDNSGAVYVTDLAKHKVVKFAATGKYERSIGGHFARPHGICIDSNSIMYVTDREKNCVVVLTTDGEFFGKFGTTGHRDELQPRGIAVDKTGNLYVCDRTGKVFVSSVSTYKLQINCYYKVCEWPDFTKIMSN